MFGKGHVFQEPALLGRRVCPSWTSGFPHLLTEDMYSGDTLTCPGITLQLVLVFQCESDVNLRARY